MGILREEELALQEEFLKNKKKRVKQERKERKKQKRKQKRQGRKRIFDERYKAILSYNRSRLTTNATVPEHAFKGMLEFFGIEYKFQEIFTISGSGYIVDFYLPDYQLVIEIDGNHHKQKEQRAKDGLRTAKLLRVKTISRVVRFSNDKVLAMDISSAKRALEKAIQDILHT